MCDLEDFQKCFECTILNLEQKDKPFQFVLKMLPNVFHHSLKLIINNDVGCMAFDKFFLYNNGELCTDNDVVRNIGLIPIDVDPEKFEDYGNLPHTHYELERFKPDACLYFKCYKNADKREKVYSRDLILIPLPDQREELITNLHIEEKIIINYLNEMEIFSLYCLAVKGYGWDHAKFKPTSLAFAKPKPIVELKEKIMGDDASQLSSLFEDGVIEVSNNTAVVNDSYKMKRRTNNYNNYKSLSNSVEISEDTNEYIWSIESVRPKYQPAHKIFKMALDTMIEKCKHYLTCIENIKPYMGSITDIQNLNPTEKRISGRMRYITLGDVEVSPDYPSFIFHGEVRDDVTKSIIYMILEKYGQEVSCYDIPFDGNMKLHCESFIEGINGLSLVEEGIELAAQYYTHIRKVYLKKLSKFI